MSDWFSRPVLFVADVDRALAYYVDRLGFIRGWRHEENGEALVAEIDRQGCSLILSSQWPDKVGKGLMFLSLDAPDLQALRTEFEGKGVEVQDGWWGHGLMVVRDLDGNELSFSYPADAPALVEI